MKNFNLPTASQTLARACALGALCAFVGVASPALAYDGPSKGVVIAQAGSSGTSSPSASGSGSSGSGSGSGMSGTDSPMGKNTETMGHDRTGVDKSAPNASQRPSDCLPTDARPECQLGALPEVDQKGVTPGDNTNPGAKTDSPSTDMPGRSDSSPGGGSGAGSSGSGSGTGSSGSGSSTRP